VENPKSIHWVISTTFIYLFILLWHILEVYKSFKFTTRLLCKIFVFMETEVTLG